MKILKIIYRMSLSRNKPARFLTYFHFSSFFQFFNFYFFGLFRFFSHPVESLIAFVVGKVPVPPPGEYSVKLSIGDEQILCGRAALDRVGVPDVSLEALFLCLSTDNVVSLFFCLLFEFKVVMFSRFAPLLTEVAEVLQSLLFPLEYQGRVIKNFLIYQSISSYLGFLIIFCNI